MTFRILILGASYGSLLGTKMLMAGHDVTLVCRAATAQLINAQGTDVRIQLKGEGGHRRFISSELPGHLDARTPGDVDPAAYDLICLGMQEPQYSDHALRNLLSRIAAAKTPCMSIMNMPPLPYLKRIPGLDCSKLESAYTDASVWQAFDPALLTLCSPDPQAFRPPGEKPNVLHVGLPTNFKVAGFNSHEHDKILAVLEADIAAVRVDGQDVPVKLRMHDSLFAPFAKWSMLATGNYRCITNDTPHSIRDAVHGDLELSHEIYEFVGGLVRRLGAKDEDLVPFEKYAKASENLLKPSSAARAIDSGAVAVERVDKLIQLIGKSLALQHPAIDRMVQIIDERLTTNVRQAA